MVRFKPLEGVQEAPMTKRVLNEFEKAAFVSEKYDEEFRHANGLIVTVSVKDETDDQGRPSFVITRRTEFHSDKVA